MFAFTDIGDDEHAAKLAELNVFAANCCDAGNRPDPEKIERAKRFGIVPYVAFGPFCGSHVQALSPEEVRLQAELQGRFVPSEGKGDAGDRGRTDLWRTRLRAGSRGSGRCSRSPTSATTNTRRSSRS